MTPTECHERLDARGLLNIAQQSGTYSLRVDTPDDLESVARAFLTADSQAPSDDVLDRLTAERVCYVGASGHVYDRLMDHCRGEVRKATFLEAFDPVDVVGVWPDPTPFEAEFIQAMSLTDEYTVWCDGEVF